MQSSSYPMFLDAFLPLNLSAVYTYAVPARWRSSICRGMRVLVPFGKNKFYTGIVSATHTTYTGTYKLKEILAVLDDHAFVSEIQLSFWQWIASYYMSTMGEVLVAAVPSVLRLESQSMVSLHSDFELNNQEVQQTQTQQEVIAFLQQKGATSLQELVKKVDVEHCITVVKDLVSQNQLLITQEINEKYSPRYATYIRLTSFAKEKKQGVFDELKRSQKQIQLLESYLSLAAIDADMTECQTVSKTQLLAHSSISEAVLQGLIKKQVLEVYKQVISRFEESSQTGNHFFALSEEQNRAYNEINSHFNDNKTVLLHGVTSSGKTEVYIQLIRDALAANKQVLYLVPEIALTVQLLSRLQQAFGNEVGIYHSKYTDQERAEVYQNLLSPTPYKVIIGVRSSIFLPFTTLGLIIVDEEHETSYKQFDPAPRYHARNAALVLASLSSSKVVLGTATPSVESLYNVQTKKYAYVSLKSRFQDVLMPNIQVVDIQDAYKKNRMKAMFSWLLMEKMQEAFANNEQVVLFQNRRGFSSHIECSQCGWVPKCGACDVSLTYHKFDNYLSCHYCGHTEAIPHSCPQCGNTQLKDRGFGTEKIEEELIRYFPEARVARMDLDTTSKKNAHKQLITAFENHQIDVLIGTQMVTKGLHFNNVSLVGILNADNLFNYPDFRANERAVQMLVQVSGRAGRTKKQGTVILQTFSPQNPLMQYVVDTNYEEFYQYEMAERKLFNYPPYCRLLSIFVKHADIYATSNAVNELTHHLRVVFGNRVLGPDNPPVAKIQHVHIKKIMIKIEMQASFETAKHKIQQLIDATAVNHKRVRFVVDVDPL